MPTALNVWIIEPRSRKILVKHEFYGETEAEAELYRQHHLDSCEYFRAAEKAGRTIELFEEIDELPDADELEKEAEDAEGEEESKEELEEEEPEEEEEEPEEA